MVSLPRERVNVDFDDEKLLEVGRRVLRMEAEEIVRAAARVGGELVEAARIIGRCKGRLVVVGMGKSGLVGRKIAATLASLGTPAFFLHAAEGSHGDLGMVCREDTGLFLSNSGQTREVLEVLPFFRRLGSPVIALTGNLTSRLARDSDVVINSGVEKEADPGTRPDDEHHAATGSRRRPRGYGHGTPGTSSRGFRPLPPRRVSRQAASTPGFGRDGDGREGPQGDPGRLGPGSPFRNHQQGLRGHRNRG